MSQNHGHFIVMPPIESSPSRSEVSPGETQDGERSEPPAGPMQNMPNLWKHLTKDARPGEPDSAGVDAFGNPLQPTNRRELSETEDEPRGAVIDDPAAVDPDAFVDEVFNYAPPDLEITHHDEPIVESFSRHMSEHGGMNVTQVHEAIRWANGYQGDNLEKDFIDHMRAHGVTADQGQEAMRWMNSYVASEDYQDDMAVAQCEKALADIKELMGTPAYWKNEQMQADHLTLIEILLCDGDGET